jgi:hypothetical protein
VDRFSGLIKNLAKVLPNYRDPDRIIHSMEGSVLSGQGSKVATLPTEESQSRFKGFRTGKGRRLIAAKRRNFVSGADDPLDSF